MGRSVKKGPFVQPVLLARVQKMNESGEKKQVLKTWSRASTKMCIRDRLHASEIKIF